MDTYTLKRAHKEYAEALNLLYMLYVASKTENLDQSRFSAALRLVWLHMNRIEEKLSLSLEDDETRPCET